MSEGWARTLSISTRGGLPRSPFAQGFYLLAGTLIAIVLLPLLLLAVLFAAVFVGFMAVKTKLAMMRRPNGVLDGRKNVRVRLPDPDEPRG